MGHLSSETKSRFARTPKEWLKVGSQINELVNEWAKRDDIVTFVGEGAGHGAPACFVPAIAEMEVAVVQAFGEEVDPLFIGDLRKRSIQFDHPVAMGAVMHEAFHARHSTLDLLKGIGAIKDGFVRGLCTWFEETRIESRAVDALPKNRAFLRACALRLVIGDLKEDEDFAANGIQAFSQLMLLTLARVDAGVLDSEDVELIHDAAVKLFGEDVLAKLRSIWVRAQAHKDDRDHAPFEKLANEWVEILKESGNDPKDDQQEIPEWLKELLESMVGMGGENPDSEDGEGSGSGKPGEKGDGEGEGSGGGGGGSVLEKMADNTETDAQTEANEQAVREVQEAIAEAKAAAAAEAADHAAEAGKMFGRGTGPGPAYTSSRLVEERLPTANERRAAVALSKQLEKARYRDRVVTKRSSVVPPGRLNARRAVAAAEQRSRGAEVTADPWTRKVRKHTDEDRKSVV